MKRKKPKFPYKLMTIVIPVRRGAVLDRSHMEATALAAANNLSATPVESVEYARTETSNFSDNMNNVVYMAWGTPKEAV